MGNNRWGTTKWVVFGVVALAATGVGRSAEAPEPCCFTNDQFAGVCRVVPAQGESCASILGYLNNPASTGKAYCDSTTIRGGWVPTRCDTEAQRRPTPVAPRSVGSR
jgi:hypothetical protein